MKKIFLAAIVFVVFGSICSFYVIHWWTKESGLSQAKVFDLQKGVNLQKLSKDLSEAGIIDSSLLFRATVRFIGHFQVKAGHYKFEPRVSPKDVYRILREGDEFKEVVLSITIPEGFTLEKILKRLEGNGLGSYDELANLILKERWLEGHGVSSPTLEGYLYPETYVYHNQLPTARQVIGDMVKSFFNHLPENYENQLKEKNLTLNQGVIFASLIELETKHDDERLKVSEVIWNRLRDKAPLAIDAALIYGIKGYDGDIKTRDLRDPLNPYNTRIHKGLPPTAIGAPSRASLEAVLNPTRENYYFYVLVADGQERHHFSKTLAEHNFYVDKLLKDLK